MVFKKASIQSNLASFLDCTTPVPQSHSLSKSEIRNVNKLWHAWKKEQVDYFRLSDVWKCYDEWSAYGAGVPIHLDNGDTLVQYYVPYLSALQIFVTSQSFNFLREEANSTPETRDSFSDSFSDDSGSEKLSRWDGCSSEEWVFEEENLRRQSDRLGHLYCQHLEKSTPYGRVPLKDKISALSQKYPGLMSLRSVDLSPASWMAVAWYPIYHIPMGRTIKDLSTCFLTYHTLSSSFQDLNVDDEFERTKCKLKNPKGVALCPFGLATYKMQGDVWVNNGGEDERLSSLLSVADSWLKQLRVQHHDFNYFMGIRRG